MDQKIVRRRGACDQCKQRKIRCNGNTPKCGRCQKRNIACVYHKPQHSKSNSEASSCIPESTDKSVAGVRISDTFASVYDSSQYEFDAVFESFSNYQDSSIPGLPGFDVLGESVICSSSPEKEHYQTWFPEASLITPRSSFSGDMLFPTATVHRSDLIPESSALSSILYSRLQTIPAVTQQSLIKSLFATIAKKSLESTITNEQLESDDKAEVPQLPNCHTESIQQYATAYLARYQNTLPFLDDIELENWLDQFSPQTAPQNCPRTTILFSVLAIGCRLHNNSPGRLHSKDARAFFERALRSGRDLMRGGPGTIIKIQAIIALTISVLEFQGPASARPYLSSAVHYALDLNLNQLSGIHSLASESHQRIHLQRIFWSIYAIEKPLSMRLGRCSFIDDDFVDLSPYSLAQVDGKITSQQDCLIRGCEFARLCSLIMKRLYGIPHSLENPSSMAEAKSFLSEMLKTWREKGSNPGAGCGDLQEWEVTEEKAAQIEASLAYHEMMFTVHQKGQLCLDSAREVLALAHRFELDTCSSNWLIIQVPITACLLLLLDIFSNAPSPDLRNNMAYLSMAAGWFGRLAVENSVTLDFGADELMELIFLAQQTQIKKK